MRAYFIRHAEKENGGHYNPILRHQDEPLTHRGRQQAENLHTYFVERPVAAIYVSRYLRTAQTAANLAQRLGIEPVADERINEIDNGLIEGMSDADIQQSYPDVWRAFAERSADFRFPGGETGEEVQQRIAHFLEEKRYQHPSGIIAVAHDGLIRTLMCYILGLPVYRRWDFQIDFCGIVEISSRTGSQGWKLIRFNQSCP